MTSPQRTETEKYIITGKQLHEIADMIDDALQSDGRMPFYAIFDNIAGHRSSETKPMKREEYTNFGISVGLCACVQENGHPDNKCEYCDGTGIFVYKVKDIKTSSQCPWWIFDDRISHEYRCSLVKDSISAKINEAESKARIDILPNEEELKAIKQAVCHAIVDRIDGFELADDYYHKLKNLKNQENIK